MAYTPIPDEELEPGKPGSSELFFKLRDNPEGIAGASPGAPKIIANAMKTAGATYNSLPIPDGATVALPVGQIFGVIQGFTPTVSVQLFVQGAWRTVSIKPASEALGNVVILVTDDMPAQIVNGGGSAASMDFVQTMI